MSSLSELTEENAALKRELFTIRRAQQDLQKALAQCKDENNALKGRVYDLERGAVDNLRAEVESLRGELEQERQAKLELELKLEACQRERDRLQRARDELASQILVAQDLEEELKHSQEQAEGLALKLQALQRRDDPLAPGGAGEADPAALLVELEAARNRAEELSGALAAVRTEKAAVESELAAARALLGDRSEGPPRRRLPLRRRSLSPKQAHCQGPTPTQQGAREIREAHPCQREAAHRGPAPAETPQESLEALHKQVAQLRASRDRLLLQMDQQSAEMERFSQENASLVQGLQEAREAAGWWESQQQASLSQIELLKDMLEESARWDLGGTPAHNMPSSPHALPPPSPTTAAAAGQEALRVRTPGARFGSPYQRRSPRSPGPAGTPPLVTSPFASYSQTPFQDDEREVGQPQPARDGGGTASLGTLPEAGPAPGIKANKIPAAHTPPIPASPLARIPRGPQAVPRQPEVSWSAPVSGARDVAAAYETLQHQLLTERARCADLDLQVRALCAELMRVADVTGSLGRAVLPALSDIGSRLGRLAALQPSRSNVLET